MKRCKRKKPATGNGSAKANTMAALIAALGISLGVDVGKTFAEEQSRIPPNAGGTIRVQEGQPVDAQQFKSRKIPKAGGSPSLEEAAEKPINAQQLKPVPASHGHNVPVQPGAEENPAAAQQFKVEKAGPLESQEKKWDENPAAAQQYKWRKIEPVVSQEKKWKIESNHTKHDLVEGAK